MWLGKKQAVISQNCSISSKKDYILIHYFDYAIVLLHCNNLSPFFRTKSALLQREISLKRAGYIRFPIFIDHNNEGFKGNYNFNKTIELLTIDFK